MATGIEVAFTGLMLICLASDNPLQCPPGPYVKENPEIYHNTAWIVKADGPRRICGWHSNEETILQLKLHGDDYPSGSRQAKNSLSCYEQINEKGDKEWICPLPPLENICLVPYYGEKQEGQDSEQVPSQLVQRSFPHIDEIDRRFLELDAKLLEDRKYVPTRLHFPKGEFRVGGLWPYERYDNYTRWYRSDSDTDESFPRGLSSRLYIRYDHALAIILEDCKTKAKLIEITPDHPLEIRNYSKYPPGSDYDVKSGYEALTYLLWYYRLGKWDTPSGYCPTYTMKEKSAVLLQCVSKKETGCVYEDGAPADNRFWPPMLGPTTK